MSDNGKSTTDRPEATDALFDYSPEAMTTRFGEKAVHAMRDGRPACGYARLAASYAFLVHPDWRESCDRRSFGETLCSMGQTLAAVQAFTGTETIH
jgi:hypothetical protein